MENGHASPYGAALCVRGGNAGELLALQSCTLVKRPVSTTSMAPVEQLLGPAVIGMAAWRRLCTEDSASAEAWLCSRTVFEVNGEKDAVQIISQGSWRVIVCGK